MCDGLNLNIDTGSPTHIPPNFFLFVNTRFKKISMLETEAKIFTQNVGLPSTAKSLYALRIS